jgi:putative thioredoxin
MESISTQLGAAPAPADLIKDSSTATFMDDVIQASNQTPVIVDFWAPWCGPCKQLGPILEKVVTEQRGAVKLVKVNIDENQEIAQQLRIQSIPAVFAFFGGRPVDGFAGAVPESQVRAFIDRLKQSAGDAAISPIDEALEQAAERAEAEDYGAATSIYQQILQHDPDNLKAVAGLARCLIAAGQLDQADEALAGVAADKRGDADITAALSALALARKTGEAGDYLALEERLAADASDHQARFDLALALYAGGRKDDAVDHLVEIVKRARSWNDEAARKQLLEFFEAEGPTSEVAVNGRRKLSSVLFS